MSDEPALRVRDLSKTFHTTRVLNGVDLQVAPGEIVALLGENGCGKSTLVKLISGVEQPDAGGTVQLAAGVRVVHQALGLFADVSVAENLALGPGLARGPLRRIRWRGVRERARTVLARFAIDVDPSTPVGALRPSEQAMVAIARSLADRADSAAGLLILDEPTATLPASETALLLDAVRGYRAAGHAVLYVTHRLDEVLAIADRVAVLRNGELVADRPVRGLDAAALVALVTGAAGTAANGRGPDASPAATASTPRVAVRGLAGDGLHGVDLDVGAGEVVGLAGLADSGGAEVLRALFGLDATASGDVTLDGRPHAPRDPRAAIDAGIAYVPPDRAGQAAFADFDVRENLSAGVLGRYWRRWRLGRRAEQDDTRALLEDYDVRPRDPDARFATLSGGNQQKVVLARWLRRDPRLILLDHPTQGVDVGARAQIHQLLAGAAAGGAGALVVTSDFDELALVADRVIVVARGRVCDELDGTAVPLTRTRITEAVYRAEAAA